MAIWIAKATIQKGISFLPWKHRVNFLFQKYVTRGLVLDDTLFESKLLHARQHYDAMNSEDKDLAAFNTLELGTGWFPVVPVCMFLWGADNIYSADITSLLTGKNISDTIRKFIIYHQNGKLSEWLGAYFAERMNVLIELENAPFEEQLNRLHLHLAVGDITRYIFPDRLSFDLIHSNNVFEHIPPAPLTGILRFFHTVLKKKGVMSHFIDMSDHYSHLDKSISPYHFLRYSDRKWKWIDNSIQPQNRMRVCQFRKLFVKTGWLILKEENVRDEKYVYNDVPLNNEFSALVPEDVMVTHTHIVCKAD